MEYHKPRDVLHVMQVLGHRNIKSTLKHTQLIDFKEDDYVSKATKNAQEVQHLVEAGFEYVCITPEEVMIFANASAR